MAGLEVFDLNEMVMKYAETLLKATSGKKGNSSRGNITIKWNRVKFETEAPNFPKLGGTPDPKWMVIHKATYKNNSAEPQENTFSEQKTTKASTQVSLTQTFSIGEETKLDMRLPEKISAAGLVFGHTLSVSNVDSQSFETQQTWTVNTKVPVPPHSERTATLQIKETQLASEFDVDTVISGKVHTIVEDENGTFEQCSEPKYIHEIVEDFRKNKLFPVPDFVKVKGHTVRITTKGRCEFVYGVEHHVTTE